MSPTSNAASLLHKDLVFLIIKAIDMRGGRKIGEILIAQARPAWVVFFYRKQV